MPEQVGLGSLSLQSGFVIAALVAGVLLAERLGGDAALLQRAVQVAIGLAIVLLAFSATTAFLREPSPPEVSLSLFEADETDRDRASEEFADFLQGSAERASEAGTIHAGVGILLVVGSVALFRRLRAIPMGILLGGTLLLLLGAPASGGGLNQLFSSFSVLFGGLTSGQEVEAGMARDIARFVVLLVGTLSLLGFAYWRWEQPSVGEPASESPV